MPHYAYVVRNRAGRAEKGTLEAHNPDEAVSILQGRDLIVVSLQEHQPTPATLGQIRRFHQSVKAQDLVVFARSLAAMTEAGLPILKALEVVGSQTRSRRLSSALEEMARAIRGGSTFQEAISRHPTIFSPFWVSLIETGEASGQLTKCLEQIASFLERTGSTQRKVVSAMIYPGILVTVAIIAIFIFTLKIIPTFGALFSSFGAELPFLTRIVIRFSDLLRRYLLIFVVATGLFLVLFRRYAKTPQGRWQIDRMKLRLPLFGPLFQGVTTEQFASNLGTLLKAGVPILHAMEITIDTCDNKVVASVLEHMRAAVREGRPLAEPLSKTDVFPVMVPQMIAVGEQTGKLATMLDELAKYYSEQVETLIARMTSLLEPILLIGMGLVIGILVISMYMPIFQLYNTMGG